MAQRTRTAFFDFVRATRFWKVAGSIEGFKFGMYLSVPIAASVFYADADFMHKLIVKLDYIRYPEADPAPPVGDDMEAVRTEARKVQSLLREQMSELEAKRKTK